MLCCAGRVVKATKSEIEESVSGSPPLELRRGSPHDRTTDSPQVATVYVHGSRHLYYEPALAHRPSQTPVPVSYPPHGSPVPPQADTLLMLLQVCPHCDRCICRQRRSAGGQEGAALPPPNLDIIMLRIVQK